VNRTGTAFLYSTYLGGRGLDEAGSIAVDRAGRAHVAGSATSGNFPTTPGAFQKRVHGFESAFVSTLSRNGRRLLRSTLVGAETFGRDIALDRAGNAYLVGFRGAGERDGVDQGYRGFLAVLDASERHLRSWAKLGGNRARASSVALGPSGNVYAVGGSGPGLETRSGLPQGRRPGKPEYPTAFVARLRVKQAARRRK